MKLTESEVHDKVADILATLRDERFGNSEQRAKLIDLFTSLYNSKDRRARLFFKRFGDFCTDAVEGILGNDSDIDVTVNMDIEEVEFEFDEEEDEYEDREEDDDSPYVSYFDDDNYYD